MKFFLGLMFVLIIHMNGIYAATMETPVELADDVDSCSICLISLGRDSLPVCANDHHLHRWCLRNLLLNSALCPLCRVSCDIQQSDEIEDISPFLCTVLKGSFARVHELIQSDVDVNELYLGIPILFDAIGRYAFAKGEEKQAEAIAICDLLVKSGASVVQAYTDNKVTAVHVAARFGLDPLCDLFLSAGASRCARTKAGRTAGGVAKKYGHERLARKLGHRK